MAPTLLPGDRLLVDPWAYRMRAPAVGEIVVVADPETRVRWLVKRVARVDGRTGEVELAADAAGPVRDSRSFGPVAAEAIVGRVYRVYFPPDRRREL